MYEVSNLLDCVQKGMEDNLYNFTKNGKCSNCGNCCTNLLPMSDKEVSRIKEYIKVNDIKEYKHLVPISNPSVDMTCPFRNDDKKICTIYKVRPEICRQFICDNEKRAKHNRALMKQTRKIVWVREEFYGKDD